MKKESFFKADTMPSLKDSKRKFKGKKITKEVFDKLSEDQKWAALYHQNLTWITRIDFNKLSKFKKHTALEYQNLTWITRIDFNKLSMANKLVALQFQNLTWITRRDFNKLDEYNKYEAIKYQNLTWMTRNDFNKLSEENKEVALRHQNLTWFMRKDYDELSEDNKYMATQYQNYSWITENHNKSLETKKREIKSYADKHGLKLGTKYLYAFREHDKRGCGVFKKSIFYKKGQYYKDWHCDIDEKNIYSFGFGIWPKGNTPIRVKIEDWGVEVASGDGKARVWGFEII